MVFLLFIASFPLSSTTSQCYMCVFSFSLFFSWVLLMFAPIYDVHTYFRHPLAYAHLSFDMHPFSRHLECCACCSELLKIHACNFS
jgi:hypothetical protein